MIKPRKWNEEKVGGLTAEELSFFAAPRTWDEINARFHWIGPRERLSVMLLLDCDGGRGFLAWDRRTQTWGLTDSGREHVRRAA